MQIYIYAYIYTYIHKYIYIYVNIVQQPMYVVKIYKVGDLTQVSRSVNIYCTDP